jgi:D-cysteine desulfhydrase
VFVEVALALGEEVLSPALPEPAHVVVAVGSGGSAAGLVAGLRLAGLKARVTGVIVNDRTPVDAAAVAKLARRTLSLLARRGADLGDVSVDAQDLDAEEEWLGVGYGHRTAESEDARALSAEREHLTLDPVYTGKAMAGLLALRDRGAFGDRPVLFWHTYDALS